ncbi:hypothetical protein T439DRAFT_322412 [Meredithblackwellia eburnea MCA 4105]
MSTPRSPTADALLKALAIKPSDDGRNLVRAETGQPFFWLGDTSWELFHRLDEEEALKFLTNRADKGFNVVMIVVMAEHGGLDFPSRAGHYPFEAAPSSTKEKYVPDVTKINPLYFDFVDWVIDQAAKLGIIVALVPTWGRYFNFGYYPDGPVIFDEENIKVLGNYLGQRYPWNPFITGGDSNRYWSQNTITVLRAAVRGTGSKEAVKALPVSDSGPITEALSQSLVSAIKAKGCQDPFLTYHPASPWLFNTPPASSDDFFPDAKWLSMDVVQSGHSDGRGNQGDPELMPSWRATYSYQAIRHMYGKLGPDGKPRPVQDLENHYESTNYGFSYDNPLWNDFDIRNGAYQSIFAGSCGITYGVNSIWQFHNPNSKTHPPIAPPTTATVPWYDELDLPGATHVGHLKNLIVSLPSFTSRTPDQSFIKSETHEGEGATLISGLRSKEGKWALVYTPSGESIEVDVGSVVKAEWFDPRVAEKQPAQEDDGVYHPPSKEDWVLILRV